MDGACTRVVGPVAGVAERSSIMLEEDLTVWTGLEACR